MSSSPSIGTKPIFLATEHTKCAPSTADRQLSDQEQLAWKSFQLWRTTMSVGRRDKIYHDVASSEYTNFHLAYHLMGTPYPIIENNVGLTECFMAIRPYEHLISLSCAAGYSLWIASKASTRHVLTKGVTSRLICYLNFSMAEIGFCYRSLMRLTGHLPNDLECRKYGVLEDKDRLEQKKKLWEQYAAYKKEWCRRFDYHVYGIRPGSNWSFLSACWIPNWTPRYNTVTDYPPRKNPYFLSSSPLSEMFAESQFTSHIPKSNAVPLIRARPEFKYLYHGPLDETKLMVEKS